MENLKLKLEKEAEKVSFDKRVGFPLKAIMKHVLDKADSDEVYKSHERDFLCVQEYNQNITNRILSDVFWVRESKAAGFSISYKEFADGLVIAEKDGQSIRSFWLFKQTRKKLRMLWFCYVLLSV